MISWRVEKRAMRFPLWVRRISASIPVAHQFSRLVLPEAQSSFHWIPYRLAEHIKATMSNVINPCRFYGLNVSRVPASQYGTVIAKTHSALRRYANEILNAFNGDDAVDWVVMWVLRYSLQPITIKSDKGGNTYQQERWSGWQSPLDCARLQCGRSCEILPPRLWWKQRATRIFEWRLQSEL